MKSQTTFLATLELVMLKLLELHGIDVNVFMQQLGFDAKSIPDPKDRMSTLIADQFFIKAITLIPDPAFALRTAECWHPSNLGALGYAWLSSATLQDGLDRLVRYSKILGQKATFQCVRTSKSTQVILLNERADSEITAAMTDFGMSLVIDMCRKNAGQNFYPNIVKMRRPQPLNSTPYTKFFGCEVIFGADQNSFEIDRNTADAPLPTANIDLAITFNTILAEQMALLDKTDIIARCKSYLLHELSSGEPSDQELANALGMSLRSLQRKLADEDTSYSRLLDELRHELAQNYLTGSHRTVNEITFLLGFSGQSAFTRAFKRWNGNSPTAYREQQSSHH
jgi:AraC-like DNA-binding protein